MATTTLDLYRSCKRNHQKIGDIEPGFAPGRLDAGAGSLYPDYAGFTRKDGSFRAPDVTTFVQGGETAIRGVMDVNPADGRTFIKPDEGVSLSTERGKFGYGSWYYFVLPEGTSIDAGLDVRQTGRDRSHFSIRCINAMTKTAYQGALDNVARSAIARAVALGRASLYFKE